jgi:aerobic C4-dicarboxylate transport protein
MKTLKWYKQLYCQVIVSLFIGILLGHFYPNVAVKMKPLGDGFIKCIRMMIAPIIFTTVVTGIASMKNMKEVGRIGIKALIYFEVVTTFSLLIGLAVANIARPGSGLHIDLNALNSTSIANYTKQTTTFNTVDFLLNIIPDTLINAFAKGDILPVLLISILFGFGILQGGEKLKPFVVFSNQLSTVLFSIVGFIMRLAPIGSFGAIAYTIGTYGIDTLVALGRLLVDVYLTSFLFIFIILGLIAKISTFSLWHFLKYIKEELLIVLGTSSSEVVLPRMISKLEKLGCGKTVVGLVLPAGYSFNLDGTSIYLTVATLFIAQAFNIDLSFGQQFTLIAVLLLTAKGAAAVTGGGFIVLAATLSSMHTIPVEGVVLLLGIDKFMAEARSLTNLIGNGVATIVIAKWEGDFDSKLAKKVLKG